MSSDSPVGSPTCLQAHSDNVLQLGVNCGQPWLADVCSIGGDNYGEPWLVDVCSRGRGLTMENPGSLG